MNYYCDSGPDIPQYLSLTQVQRIHWSGPPVGSLKLLESNRLGLIEINVDHRFEWAWQPQSGRPRFPSLKSLALSAGRVYELFTENNLRQLRALKVGLSVRTPVLPGMFEGLSLAVQLTSLEYHFKPQSPQSAFEEIQSFTKCLRSFAGLRHLYLCPGEGVSMTILRDWWCVR